MSDKRPTRKHLEQELYDDVARYVRQVGQDFTESGERAVQMVFEQVRENASHWAAIVSIAAKIGCTAQTLRNWVVQAERDQGLRNGLCTEERDGIMACKLRPRN